MVLRRRLPGPVPGLFACALVACALASCGGDDGKGGDDTAPDVQEVAPLDEEAAAIDEVVDEVARDAEPAETTADAPEDAAADTATETAPVISLECQAVTPSLTEPNTLTVNGTARKFLLLAPDGATGPGGKWPLVFLWHGFMGASMGYAAQEVAHAKDFHKAVGGAVNDTRMPFLLVTPLADQQAMLDWTILDTYDDVPNPDIDLFDTVRACLDAKYGVDPDHVHSVGFSAGAIMTDLLGVMRGDVLASTLTWSGGYLVNPANAIESFPVIWPDPVASGYPQVFFHGGATDQWEAGLLFTAHFNEWTEADVPWLNGLGHDAILCPHTQGHTPPSSRPINGYLLDFFAAHPRGTTTSPFASGLPTSFPSTCVYRAKTPN